LQRHSFLEGSEDGGVKVYVRAVRFHWR
jgi:hypothetical protein